MGLSRQDLTCTVSIIWSSFDGDSEGDDDDDDDDEGSWLEVVARCITPIAARLMIISEGEEPWPRPLGFWMWVSAVVAMTEDVEFVVGESELRVTWITSDH